MGMVWEAQTLCLLPLWGSALSVHPGTRVGTDRTAGTSVKFVLSCSWSGRLLKGHLGHLKTNIPFKAANWLEQPPMSCKT